MTVTLCLGERSVDVEIRGMVDSFVCMSGDQHVPYGDISAARQVEWSEVRAALGWRVGGSYIPGRLATGWYTQKNVKQARQFLAVYRDRSNLLLIETTLQRPCRLVVAVPDAPTMAAEITERLG